jgi:hypothetical protein
MSNPDGSWFFLCLKVKFLAASPRSNSRQDFANLSYEPWPLVLLFEDLLEMTKCLYGDSSSEPVLETSTRAFVNVNPLFSSQQYHKGTIPLELVDPDSFRDLTPTARVRPSTTLKVLSLPNSVHFRQQPPIPSFSQTSH